jgi:hypothetical protein
MDCTVIAPWLHRYCTVIEARSMLLEAKFLTKQHKQKYKFQVDFKTKNSMVWVRERTTPTERPPRVGEVIVNFLGLEGATWLAWRIPTAVFSVF